MSDIEMWRGAVITDGAVPSTANCWHSAILKVVHQIVVVLVRRCCAVLLSEASQLNFETADRDFCMLFFLF